MDTGLSRICETEIQQHDSGCVGGAWVKAVKHDQALAYLAQFDVSCGHTDVVVYPDVQAFGYSEFLVNVIFRVEGKGATARFSGNVYQAPQILNADMCLYDWTDSAALLTEMGQTAPLIDSHIYRMTVHVKMRGFNDPDEIVIQLAFENVEIEIMDQPIICCPMAACLDEVTKSPQPPKLG